MKKYEYLLCILSFCTLFTLIEFNNYQKLKEFENNFVLSEVVNKEESLDNTEIIQDEISLLKEQYNNDDVVGTLSILNTSYKVPLVQTKDNSYYLKHLPNKEYSILGSIFVDYRVNLDTSKKLLIYGHNDAKIEMPFDILENYYDINYLNNHKYIEIKTSKNVRRYEIFSVFVEPTDYFYMNVNFSDEEYAKHLEKLQDKSFYQIDTTLTNKNNILILQTCSTHKDYLKYKKKYLIIALKEVSLNIE